ncbi:MAG TPA: AI-2E family transporter [Deltaproteobacteria bacterium]|nr:AI-2E family transporter [Deltaproteobacteria bacterium]
MDAGMNTSPVRDRLVSVLVGMACLVVIVAGMKAMAPILNIFLLAWLLADAISPLPNWMMRRRVPRTPAAVGTLLIVIFCGIAIATVMSWSVIGLSQKLPQYQATLTGTYGTVVDFLASKGVDITQVSPLASLTPARIFSFAGMILGQIGNLLGDTLLLLILVVILLFEFIEDPKPGQRDGKADTSLLSVFREASSDVRVYVSVTSSTGALQAVINIALYAVMGIDYAVTWGILFFFMNFIPVIGGFISVIPPVALGFLESGWEVALAVLVLFSINNFVWDNILKPRYMGRSLNIPFLLIILSVIFWSWVLGSVGTIVAVPLTMAIRSLYYGSDLSS